MGYPARKMIFQSTLPRGERHLGVRMVPGNRRISIHAPTGGSDDSEILLYDQIVNFNPRSHEGSDERKIRYRYRMDDFNPRSHEGSDAVYLTSGFYCIQFQPTLPRGERPELGGWIVNSTQISTHAPTRGATI